MKTNKQTNNKFLKVLLCSFIFIFYSCSENLYEENENPSQIKISIREMKFDELFKTDKKFKNFIEKVGKTSSYEKMAFKKQNGFTIADDNVKIITSDSIVSYTMAIKRDDNKGSLSFENLVIQEKANTNLKAYILKYYPSKMTSAGHQSFYLESNIEIKRLEGFTGFKKNKSQNKTSESDCYINVDQLWCSQPFAGSSKHHLAGASCSIATLYVRSIKVLVPDQCGSTGGGASSGSTGSDGGFGAPYGTPGGGGYNNNYPSENPTNPTNPTNPENNEQVLTTPVLNSENSFNIKNEIIFYSNLNPHQQYWAGNNLNSYSQIIQYLIDNQWSEESKAFAIEAINSIEEGSDVDLAYKVIVDKSFKDNPCLNGVYEKLGQAPTFDNYLKNFNKNFSVANLKLSVGISSNHPTANAVTSTPQNFLIDIKFNPNNLQRPQLDIARTFIHELIHAEIYRKLLSCAKLPNVNINNYTESQWQVYINNLKNNFPGLFDYYMRYEYDVPKDQQVSGAQHQAMAQHYRQTIIQTLKEFDNNSHSDQFYNALAWTGLMGEGNFNSTTGLPTNPTVAWQNIPQNDRIQIITTSNNFNTTNKPCQ